MIGPPVMPTDVVVYKRDKPPVRCELVYRGLKTDEDGTTCHIWSCPTHFNPRNGDRISIGMMPALTGITFGEDDE